MLVGLGAHSSASVPFLAGGDEDEQVSALDAGPTEDEPVDESEDERDAVPLALEEESAEVDNIPAGENDLAEFRPAVPARSRSTNGAAKGARKPRSLSKKGTGVQDGNTAKKPRARGGRSKKAAAASAAVADEASAGVGGSLAESAVVGDETTSATSAIAGESGETGGDTLDDSIDAGGAGRGRGRGRGAGRAAGRGRGRGRGGATGAVAGGGNGNVEGDVNGASVGGEDGKRAAASDGLGPLAKTRKLDAK